MKRVILLIAALALMILSFPRFVRSVTVSCSVSITADKTNACVGDTVNFTETIANCNGLSNITFAATYMSTGAFPVSAICTACDSTVSAGTLTIYVTQITNISPSLVSMCPGSSMVFTPVSNPTNILCNPSSWSISPPEAGTIDGDGPTITFTLSPSFNNGTVTLSALCGVMTNTVITVTTNNPLAITSQPVSQVVCPGQNVSLSVGATGSSLHYQWRYNGVNLIELGRFYGTTNATLIISNVFATSTVCTSVPCCNPSGGTLDTVVSGDTYTYQASGCMGIGGGLVVSGILGADPDGFVYASNDCVTVEGLPQVASGIFRYPGYTAFSLIGYTESPSNYYYQMGESGSLLIRKSGTFPQAYVFRIAVNDRNYGANSGSWNACLTHTIEGPYDCVITSDCGFQISTTATIAVSTPCDGIPDSWRLQYFGTTNIDTNTCAFCDPDGDGYNNLQEYESGTDPTNAFNYPSALPTDLVGWWKLNEGAGTNILDSSFNGYTGFLEGTNVTSCWSTGILGNAIALGIGPSGSNWIRIPYSTGLLPTQQFTLAAWMKTPSNNTVYSEISSWDAAETRGNYELDLTVSNADFLFGDSDGNYVGGYYPRPGQPNTLAPNTWHHLAGVYDGTNVSLFVDGIFITNQVLVGGISPLGDPVWIGFPDPVYDAGAYEDVRIYSRALGSNDILALYNTDTIGDGIPDWWRFQYFGSGTTTNSLTCATCDYDGDGVNNLTEFLEGRDPTKPAVSDTNGLVNLSVYTPLE